MTSNGKNNNKIYIFKEGSNPLFPISNKMPNSSKLYSPTKINQRTDSKTHKNFNEINPNLQHKNIKDNISVIKNFNEIKKTYSSSRPKDEGKILNLNLNNSNIKNLKISPSINNINFLEKNKKNSNNRKSNLNDTKVNIKNINLEFNNYSKDLKNNINISSSKKLGNSQIFSNNNSIYNMYNINLNKNINELTNTKKVPLFNNILLKDIYSTYNKGNSHIINQMSYVKNYLQTDINNKNTNTPKIGNVKLIFNNKYVNGKKLNINDTPIILRSKESPFHVTNTNPRDNYKYSLDKNIIGDYKLHIKMPKKNNSKENIMHNMNLNNFLNFKKEEKLKETYHKNKYKVQGPEDLHFYYILVMQEGKKIQAEFKD